MTGDVGGVVLGIAVAEVLATCLAPHGSQLPVTGSTDGRHRLSEVFVQVNGHIDRTKCFSSHLTPSHLTAMLWATSGTNIVFGIFCGKSHRMQDPPPLPMVVFIAWQYQHHQPQCVGPHVIEMALIASLSMVSFMTGQW
jgi:hypothetical protein